MNKWVIFFIVMQTSRALAGDIPGLLSGGKGFLELRGGARFPGSADTGFRFDPGPAAEIALGYAYPDGLALSVECGTGWFYYSPRPFVQYLQQQNGVAGAEGKIEIAYWTHTPIQVVVRREILIDSFFMPYALCGAGLAVDVAHDGDAAVKEQGLTWFYPIRNHSWINLEMAPGLGIAVVPWKGTRIFAQAKWEIEFGSSSGESIATTDSPIIIVPVQAGIGFDIF